MFVAVRCINPQTSLHGPPASQPLQSAWLIFHGNVPTLVGKVLCSIVCAKYFKDECFSKLHQYEEEFAEEHGGGEEFKMFDPDLEASVLDTAVGCSTPGPGDLCCMSSPSLYPFPVS
ncbi:hypothetical protein XENOCAPTIV_026959 [Xenoophorus captivus]|uniref:Uncharacterized protein n=1 Tax=Xenoophorus captivus TaxID=1517983 RepID=A0ABV0S0G1_9TELE